MVGVQGFEPWTLWSQTRCATGLRYTPSFCSLTQTRPTGRESYLALKTGTPSFHCSGGEGGIRTRGRVTPAPPFQGGDLSHSSTSPWYFFDLQLCVLRGSLRIIESLRIFGGGDRNRTRDLLLAKQPLSQLSYTPTA